MAGPSGARTPQRLLVLLLGLIHVASSIFVVKNETETSCIMANFSAAFFVNYSSESGIVNTTFELPQNAMVLNSSSCGKENASNPILVIGFGKGHTLTMNFTRTPKSYQVQLLRFTFNLSDEAFFHNASTSSEEVSVESKTDIQADIDKKYRCISSNQITMNNVTVTFSDVTIQAYLSNNSFSKEETRCSQDMPSPAPAPTSHPTSAPVPAPTTPPTPGTPPVAKYNVSDRNGTCLLASMGLQLNITYEKKDNTSVRRIFNINPDNTTVNGSCSPQVTTLELKTENSTLVFRFGMNATTSKFFLKGIHLNTAFSDAKQPTFEAFNDSLKELQATVGNSYKCNAEENVQVTDSFSVNIFRVRVQAFKVEGDKFGSVEECLLDENNMLIPIAVGGALAGLVLIVLIAYLIGRKRSHAGYQTI
ncbi:lysosome-associated membrane glycoprotein 1 [Phascolarctos cinereus]|uniref:Lysosome-associated membrane glycoprotein 1 n=1 Tax=Phascolarctos cinereus TaxID=38626 RepID=A0A6P5IQC5_PHACI|nr:lysosome-associated membrane glycoprotein 1 [Phascolarctos cinereus]